MIVAINFINSWFYSYYNLNTLKVFLLSKKGKVLTNYSIGVPKWVKNYLIKKNKIYIYIKLNLLSNLVNLLTKKIKS
jgi:hypothetical protein